MVLAGSVLSNNTGRTHAPLARRLLFPTHSGDLPRLLSTLDAPQDLDAELYDAIALALRAYVNPWWTKISRYDKHLLPQIASVLTLVLRALEPRLRALDLSALLFRHLPAILTQHYRDYRNAASKLSSSYATGGAASLPQLFHHLQPHIALSPDGNIDPEYYRQIVDHVLKACLPPEDYAPEVERLIVREVLVKVLVHDVIPKVSQPWFIQQAILDVLGDSDQQRLFRAPIPPAQPPNQSSFSLHTLIVLVLSALQSFSATCLALIHAYKHAITTIKHINQSPTHTPRSASPSLPLPQQSAEFQPSTSSQPHHSRMPSPSPPLSTSSSLSYPSPSVFPPSRQTPITHTSPPPLKQTHHDNYASQPLTLFSEVFLTSDRLTATMLMTFLVMVSIPMTSFLDKLLPHILYSILSPASILNLIRLAKRTMFPNGYPAPPPVDPSPDEQAAIRQRLADWSGTNGLSYWIPLFLGTDPTQTINAAIDPLTCQPCNVHLVVILIDRILAGLFPELVGETSVTDSSLANANTASAGNTIIPHATPLISSDIHENSNVNSRGERRPPASGASTPAAAVAPVGNTHSGGGGVDDS